MGDVEQPRWLFGNGGQGVAKHRIAEGAGCADDVGSGSGEFTGAIVADSIARFFAQESQTSAGTTAETAFASAVGLDELAEVTDHGATRRNRSTCGARSLLESRAHVGAPGEMTRNSEIIY